MILAAGLGTRLGDIGRHTPKALVTVGDLTMIERIARRLVDAGADRLIVNVHHHADAIEAFVREQDGFGVEVLFSHEPDAPLETGGGLVAAAPLFRRDGPFFLHNVDIITDADLAGLLKAHRAEPGRLATLAVQDRASSRALLFDEVGLFGRTDAKKGIELLAREPRGARRAVAFAGIHVIEPLLLDRITERGAFSILDPYLRLAADGARIAPWDIGDADWLEIGTPERLEEARRRNPA
jgi:NDP-sugar pyrophosphorylase family protein